MLPLIDIANHSFDHNVKVRAPRAHRREIPHEWQALGNV